LFAAQTKEPAMTTRLETIATRQKKSFVRDVVFAAFIALAAVVSVASVSTAVQASTQVAQR
jgi:hypothetical protein